jgi:hypothetical protein
MRKAPRALKTMFSVYSARPIAVPYLIFIWHAARQTLFSERTEPSRSSSHQENCHTSITKLPATTVGITGTASYSRYCTL